jgi:DNA invertase Pin-like site-specific DNA recombinase
MNRINEMIQLRKSGKTFQEIGDKYNISKQRIYQLLRKYKVEKTDINEIKISKYDFIKARKLGKGWRDISKELKISDITLKKYVNFDDYPKYMLKENEYRCHKCKQIKDVGLMNNKYRCKECENKIHKEKQYWKNK